MGWIEEQYVKTGQVRFAYRHIATLGEEAVRSAEASECAADQDQFWAYHDLVFADQASTGSRLDDARLIELADQLGLDIATFEACLSADTHAARVAEETGFAQQSGIRATPGFVINQRLIVGAQPFGVFARAINEELAALGISTVPNTADATQIEGLILFPPDPPPAQYLEADWLNCGIYAEPVELDLVIASMLHGAVWISYQTNLPAAQVDTLHNLVREVLAGSEEPMVILSPAEDQSSPILATAWRVQLSLDEATDPRLAQFLAHYQVSPYTPQAGQPCSGGSGQPEE